MAQLAMLADIQQMVYPKKVTCKLHVTAKARVSSLNIVRRFNHCATPPATNQCVTTLSFQLLRTYLTIISLKLQRCS